MFSLSCWLVRTSSTSHTTLEATPESGFQGRAPKLDADAHLAMMRRLCADPTQPFFIEDLLPDVAPT